MWAIFSEREHQDGIKELRMRSIIPDMGGAAMAFIANSSSERLTHLDLNMNPLSDVINDRLYPFLTRQS